MTGELEALQALIDANDQPVFALDCSLRYTAFNRAHAALMRLLYGAEIALGGRLADYQTVDGDRRSALANLTRALAGEQVVARAFAGETERERHDIDIVPTPLTDAAGTVTGVVVRAYDITMHRRAEADLRASEERYGLLFENMLEGFAYCRMLYDDEGRADDFVYLAVNPAFTRLTGLQAVVGKRVTEVIPAIKAETPELLDLYGNVARSGVPTEFDLDFTPLAVWLHISVFRPEPDHFVAMFADLTKSRQAERELREAHERLDLAQRAAGAGIWDLDPATRDFVWSPQLFALFGLSAETDEATISSWEKVVHPDDRGSANAAHAAALADHTMLDTEYRIVKPNGEVRWVNALGHATYDEQGRPIRMTGLCVDITERKRAADEIKRLNDDLERRVRERTRDLTAANAELEEFVHSIAHDLRSPLRALSGFSELVQADYYDVIGDTGRDYLRRIRAAAHHLGELMDALLSLSNVSHCDLNICDVDLSALGRDAVGRLREADPGHPVMTDIEDGMVARGDPALCEIVVQNLLGNAWKFSAGESPARISFGAQCVDGRRAFCVRDNGVGFDPAYTDKLFKPFERLHTAEEFPGTGIGLATVRRAVARLGGSCWAEGAPGGGAQVWFTLGDPW